VAIIHDLPELHNITASVVLLILVKEKWFGSHFATVILMDVNEVTVKTNM
jgi:hypothetical protein